MLVREGKSRATAMSKVASTSQVASLIQRPVSAALKRMRRLRLFRKIQSWNAHTRIWRSATTPTSRNLTPFRRRSATRTLRRPVRSPLSSRPSMKQSRNVTSQLKKSVMDQVLSNAKQFTRVHAPLAILKNSQVSLLVTPTVKSFR